MRPSREGSPTLTAGSGRCDGHALHMQPVDGDGVAGGHGLGGGGPHQGGLGQYPLHASSAQMVLGALSEAELGGGAREYNRC